MRVVPSQLTPAPRPSLSDAQVLGSNVAIEATVIVAVGAVGFSFRRDEAGDWTGGEAVTLGRGTELDEAWLTTARSVAVECLRAAILEHGGEEAPSETLQCPECGRLLCSTELPGPAEKRNGVDCGPEHVVRFRYRSLVFCPDGTSHWETP